MNELFDNPYFIKTLHSIGLLIVVAILSRMARSMAAKRGKVNSEAPYVIRYTAITFFAFALIFIWLEDIGPVMTALTIVAAALTIVSKELLLCFLGSFVIFWRELFALGDRVEVADHSGDVIAKGILFFTLLETGRKDSTGHSTGRLVKIPNAMVLTQPVINATRGAGYVWNELRLTVSRGSDWKKGRQFLLDCAVEYQKQENIDLDRVKRSFERKRVFFKKLDPIVYIGVASSGVTLTIRYLCRSRMIRESEDFITTRFLDALEPGILELAEEQPL